MNKNNNTSSGKENSKREINPDFANELKEGILEPVTQMVKNNDDLIMFFRGKYINIYYRGHSLFRIEQLGHKKNPYYKVFFNFNHARYTEDWEEVLQQLEAIGYSLNHSIQHNKENIVSTIVKSANIDFWNKSKIIFSKLIDDFFSIEEDKLYDYFNMCKNINKNKFIEKQRQQKIAIINNNCDNGYFIYDIEYTQARNSKDEKNSGRFDMLALKFENKVPIELVLIELKSTESACTSNSGVDKHYKDLKDYINNHNYMRIRKEEAICIFNLYSDINIFSADKIEEAENLDVKILFIFTDTARSYFKKNNIPYDNQIEFEDGDNVIKL
ncbi:hypothetical protein D2A34_19875 [Clostridium chromiireducens]|uniref:DUF4263 domain-containing protein n=1 Tax=Clostridium chromiireducens TaxID=225345 RepID=A0A399IJ92_9CLOT|nr:hypothetical protein [Clostridium chromiireducens]RII33088.1 hypothetical protein D2A34_19875 [Clostridium chromiireducens]